MIVWSPAVKLLATSLQLFHKKFSHTISVYITVLMVITTIINLIQFIEEQNGKKQITNLICDFIFVVFN